MRTRKAIIFGVLTLALASLGWAQFAFAHSFRTGPNVTVGQSERVEDTLFVAGRTIDINAEVDGDIFCAGQSVTISGTVNGDVICAGQTVTVTGTVNGDVRLAGQTVTLGATVTGNATIGGQSFTLGSTGRVDGDLSAGAQDLNINGPVGRDVAVGSSNVVISSSVGRNINGTVENLEIAAGAQVGGDVDYTSMNDANISQDASVQGEVNRTTPSKPVTSKKGAVFGFGIAWFIYWFIAMLVTAMAIALLFPRALHAVTDKAIPTPWKALLTGFLANLAIPFVLLLLAITFVGLPLALIIGFLWVVALLLSGIFFAYYLGRLILKKSRKPLLIMLVGASVLLVLYFIPILGVVAVAAAVWIGTGMLFLEAFQRSPKPQYEIETSSNSHARKPKS